AGRKALRQTFHYRGLADACLPDERRIVHPLPQQDIHDAGDLGVATPHRFEIAAARLRRDIDADALQHVAGIEESFERVPHLSVASEKMPVPGNDRITEHELDDHTAIKK